MMGNSTDECRTVRVPEAARQLGISRGAAYLAIQRGHLPHIRLGKCILVPKAALDAMLAGGGK